MNIIYYIILCFVFNACICKGQHSKSIHNNTACKFTTEETWWSPQLGVRKKFTHVSVSASIIGEMSCKISARGVLAKIQYCASLNLFKFKSNHSLITWLFYVQSCMIKKWNVNLHRGTVLFEVNINLTLKLYKVSAKTNYLAH